jgi:hypothetical protein
MSARHAPTASGSLLLASYGAWFLYMVLCDRARTPRRRRAKREPPEPGRFVDPAA